MFAKIDRDMFHCHALLLAQRERVLELENDNRQLKQENKKLRSELDNTGEEYDV